MPKLIENPLKPWSVHLTGLVSILAFAYDYLETAHKYLPDGWFKWAALAILVARVIKQGEEQL